MRKIIFRGMSVCAGEGWVYGDLSFDEQGERTLIRDGHGVGVDVNPDSVGQYTGRVDCKGTMIFEGDRLKVVNGSEQILIVAYHPVLAAFCLVRESEWKSRKYNYVWHYFNEFKSCEFEVVGNLRES